MPENLDFNRAPYYDDYEAEKRFMKILARPEFAVQARDFNQLQSIMQQQIERFGNHVFKNGSMVIPGDVKVDLRANYIKLQNTWFDENGAAGDDITTSTFTSITDTFITNVAGTLKAKVITGVAPESGDPTTIFVKQLNNKDGDEETSTFDQDELLHLYKSVDDTFSTFTDFSSNRSDYVNKLVYVADTNRIYTVVVDPVTGEFSISDTLMSGSYDSQLEAVLINYLKTDPLDAEYYGDTSLFYVSAGVYYVNGYFNVVDEETLVLDKYSNTPTLAVGFNVVEDIITEDDDASLNDPAFGSSNEGAPGAHRFKIDLSLTKYSLDNADEGTLSDASKFVQLLRIKDGEILDIVRNAEYNVLNETLARRTYDESGDYIVNKFGLDILEHLDDGVNSGVYTVGDGGDIDDMVYSLSPGKAYIRGYEVENQSPVLLSVDKARGAAHRKTENNNYTTLSLGNYVVADIVSGVLPDIETAPIVDLMSSAPAVIGTARVRAVSKGTGLAGKYRFYLFNIQMNTNEDFGDVRSMELQDGASNTIGVYDNLNDQTFDTPVYNPGTGEVETQQITVTTLYDQNINKSFYTLPRSPVYTINDISYTSIRYDQQTSVADGGTFKVTFNAAAGNLFESGSTSQFILYSHTDSEVVAISSYLYSAGNTVLEISGLTTSGVYSLTYREITPNPSIKTKTLISTSTVVFPTPSGTEFSLSKADIYKLNSITGTIATVVTDITDRFVLDDGQRDSYYDLGKVTLKAGEDLTGVTDLTVDFAYFQHSGDTFFTRDSYSGAIPYADIPHYQNGSEPVSLTNVIDFRPRINDAGTGFTGTGSSTTALGFPNSSFISDIEYYVGRIDKIVVDKSGQFSVVSGKPEIEPNAPVEKENSITLYELEVTPYTYEVEDITITELNHRRYTMAHIRGLEKRIQNIEYYTSLNLLEQETKDLTITDELGNNKFKNGFVADNFSSHSHGEVENSDHKISIDIEEYQARPISVTKAVALKPTLDINGDLDVSGSANTKINGDMVTLDYSEVVAASQAQVSDFVNVNPFSVFIWRGSLTLNPESDFWYEEERRPAIIQNAEGILDTIEFQRFTEQNNINVDPDDDTPQAFGTVWNNWQTTWTGVTNTTTARTAGRLRFWNWRVWTQPGVTTTTTTTTNQRRTGIQTNSITRIVNEQIDDRIVSRTAAPFIRSRKISVEAEGLKPNTKFYLFFDNREVTQYITQTNKTSGSAGLISTNDGSIEADFTIPNNSSIRFRTGNKKVVLFNKPTLSDATADSSADAFYRATGIVNTRQATILSTRVRDIVQSEVSDTRSFSTNTTTTRWVDPLAQSFQFSDAVGGCFLTSIEVPFTSKDLTIPISLEIRTMVNGFPGQEILPGSKVFKRPADITVTPENTLNDTKVLNYTKFEFNHPVYINENDEYCFVLVTNSDNYNVWIASQGKIDIISGASISKQPYLGILFKSQNGTTWSEEQTKDMTFKINRADFSANTTGSVSFNVRVPDSDIGIPRTDPFLTDLNSRAFRTKSGSSIVRLVRGNTGIKVAPAGLENDSRFKVYFDTSQVGGAIDFNGIHEDVMFDPLGHPVTFSDRNFVYFDVSGSLVAGSKVATSGGLVSSVEIPNIRLKSKVNFSVIHSIIQELNFGETDIDWNIVLQNQDNSGNQEVINIDPNETVELYQNFNVYDSDQEYLVLSANMSRSTDRKFLSPIIDVQRLGALLTSYKINDITAAPSNAEVGDFNAYVPETNSLGGTATCKYVMRRTTLNSPAKALKVLVDINRPAVCEVDAYYRIKSDDTTKFDDIDWIPMTATGYPDPSSHPTSFNEYEWDAPNLTSFSEYSIKLVLRSSDDAIAPKLQDFRAIATAT